MADQTEQEPIERERYNAEAEEAYRIAMETPRPDILTAMHDGTLTTDMVFEWALHPAGDVGPFFLMIYSFLQTQVRERDAQIARLSAQVEQLQREIAVDDQLLTERQRILDACPCPVHGSCVPHVLETLATVDPLRAEVGEQRERALAAERELWPLRAERDAAQQEIAELEHTFKTDDYARKLEQQIDTLTEALDVAAQDIRDWVKTARGLRDRVADPDHDPSTPHLRGIVESEQVLTRITAALQSTRPQEEV